MYEAPSRLASPAALAVSRRETLRELIVRDYGWIRGVAIKITQHLQNGEDLAQEAVARMLEHADDWMGNEQNTIRPWALVIMRNAETSRRRLHSNRMPHDDANDPAVAIRLLDHRAYQEGALLMSEFCDYAFQLPPSRFRCLLTLILNDGNYEAAADEAGISLGGLKAAVHHARCLLGELGLSPGRPKPLKTYQSGQVWLSGSYIEKNQRTLRELASRTRQRMPERRGGLRVAVSR